MWLRPSKTLRPMNVRKLLKELIKLITLMFKRYYAAGGGESGKVVS